MTVAPRAYLVALGLLVAALGLSACGGGDSGGGGGASEAKTLQPSDAQNASGSVTWCIGKDTSGAFKTAVDKFNAQNPKLEAKLLELPENADIQREQQIQRLRAESNECDVLGMDVIWTAEYAASGWLYDLTPVVEEHEGEFIPSTVETTEYEGKRWAIPFNTNAGFLFYRTDEVPKPPSTWEEVYKKAKEDNGLVYQGERYEGLTVNFLELLYSAGGKALSEDGETVEIDSPETREVLDFMRKGIEEGAVAKAVTTYEEESSRRAFEAGNATFMRNWPYAYALGKESNIAGDFEVTKFPGFGGNEGAGVVGGYNLGISAFTDNPDGSLAFAEFLVTEPVQKEMFLKATLPAVVTGVYEDPEVKKEIPFTEELLKAVEQAQARPVSPVYTEISEAIFNNVFEVLNGRQSSDAAASQMNSEIEDALKRF
ncbi:MAG TPA: ABC transporter substrate-binding protein [Solirubrobacterales bacterium]|nr:ABC transporter substrate-binding protein [Solirubrobacterales bacterium]